MARKQKKKKLNEKEGDEQVKRSIRSFMMNEDDDKDIIEAANKIAELTGAKTVLSAIRPIIRQALNEVKDRLMPKQKAS